MKTRVIKVGSVRIGGGAPLALIAGPCIIESRAGCLNLARRLAELASAERIPLIFKASYDKANRSSHASFRGPGIEQGLAILAEVKAETGLPILTDVHSEGEVPLAAQVADVAVYRTIGDGEARPPQAGDDRVAAEDAVGHHDQRAEDSEFADGDRNGQHD